MSDASASEPRCPNVTTCALFPKFNMRASLKVWTVFYCQGRYQDCERYRRTQRGLDVAPNLLPNGKELNVDLLIGTGS